MNNTIEPIKQYKKFPIGVLDSAKPRILIFIGSLCSGGKERRLIELLTYFKGKGQFEFLVVVTRDEVHYKDFYKLDIPYHVIKKRWKRNDLTVFYQLYKICKQYRPNLIHAWGRMQALYTLPTVIWQNVPLVNSQIAGAPQKLSRWSILNLIDRLNFRFSKVVLANSKAGFESFNPPAIKSKVIYNGINNDRFRNLSSVEQVKTKYGINTPYAVLMAASFTAYKNYDLFFKVADKVTRLRDDVTFIGVGGYAGDDSEYKRMLGLSAQNPRILFPGKINDVEDLVNACTVGVLFSTNGEGISNSIMEYMALAKPVIANNEGGTKEILHDNVNGYLVVDQTEDEIASLIIELINDQGKREAFGKSGKAIIEELFTLDRMGREFAKTYQDALV